MYQGECVRFEQPEVGCQGRRKRDDESRALQKTSDDTVGGLLQLLSIYRYWDVQLHQCNFGS